MCLLGYLILCIAPAVHRRGLEMDAGATQDEG